MQKINFQDGTLVKPATVTIDNVEHQVTPEQYNGTTPLSAEILNQLQTNIETAIGEVSSFDPLIVAELPTTNIQEKTMYLVLSSSEDEIEKYNAYIYKNNEWKQIGSDIDVSKLTINLVENSYTVTLTEAVAGGGTITIPAYYKVGSDRLTVHKGGRELIKGSTSTNITEGHYCEVGAEGSLSNQIQLTNDWSASAGDVFKFTIRTNGQGVATESDTVIVSATEPVRRKQTKGLASKR